MLPPSEAYQRARQILCDLFGQPHEVARSLIDGLLWEANALSNNEKALIRLAVRMQSCSIALRQMNYEADLNLLAVLQSIVRGFSTQLRSKWVEEADRISLEGGEPNFIGLTELVTQRSRIARGRFGQLVGNSYSTQNRSKIVENEREDEHRNFRPSAFPMIITKAGDEPSVSCVLCKGQHSLHECSRFYELDIRERWATAKKLGACSCCLNDSHIAPKCRIRSTCSVNGCAKPHRPLLHFVANKAASAIPAEKSQVCTLRSSGRSVARLGVLPVLIQTPGGRVETIAFLDSGSGTTLVKRSFTTRHGLAGEPFRLAISSLKADRSIDSAMVCLKLMSMDGAKATEIDEAFLIDDLPIKPASSIQGEAGKWPHLRYIDFVDIEKKEVTILIDCYVLEAHWVMEQRIGGK